MEAVEKKWRMKVPAQAKDRAVRPPGRLLKVVRATWRREGVVREGA